MLKPKVLLPILLLLLLIASCGLFRKDPMPMKEREVSFVHFVRSGFATDDYSWKDCNENHGIERLDCAYERAGLEGFRDSSRLEMLHNLALTIGYERFISKDEYFNKRLGYDHNVTLAELVDRLHDSYDRTDLDSANYYIKFWKRRRADGNAETVKSIIDDVKAIYVMDEVKQPSALPLNDTLLTLIQFDLELRDSKGTPYSSVIALEYFNYLREIGLHQSAFNLVYFDESWEGELTDSVKLELISTLELEYIPMLDWRDAYNWEGRGSWIYTKLYYGP